MLPSSSARMPSLVSAGRSRSSLRPFGEGAELSLQNQVAFAGLLIGVEDDDAAVAIDDHFIAAGDVGQEAAQADDGGNFEHAGHDGGVARLAPRLGGEGVDQLRIEIGRLARRQIMGENDHRLANFLRRLALLSRQVAENRFLDVEQIRRPHAERRMVRALCSALAWRRIVLLTAYSALWFLWVMRCSISRRVRDLQSARHGRRKWRHNACRPFRRSHLGWRKHR